MKILVYGLQSSGASLFCYFMAQKPHSIGVVDLNNHRQAPALQLDLDVVLKAVITTLWSLEDHKNQFSPDKTILFVRNPYNNYFSLKDKVYGNKNGTVDEKFQLLEELFAAREQVDQVIFYEDFIKNHGEIVSRLNELGWHTSSDYFRFPRTPQEIFQFNCLNSEWCRTNPAAPGPQGGWGMGNLSGGHLNPELSAKPYIAGLDEKVRLLCPTLYDYYSSRQDNTR